MRKSLLKALSLCLLLTLIAGTALPGYAGGKAKPTIVNSPLWAGVGKCAVLVQNLPSDATSFSITSKDKSVLKAGCDDKKDRLSLWVKPLKAGTSKVTVKYKSGGKVRSVSTVFTVKKYPDPFQWIKINGKKIDLKKNKIAYDCLKYSKNKITVDYKISSGWKLNGGDALWGYINREGQNTEMLSWKKGKAINLSSDFTDAVVAINLVNKKTGDKFFYMIFITP